MFKQLLASIGIGAARVDTMLYESTTIPGGTLSGEARLRGGDVAQQVGQVYLFLKTSYKTDEHTHSCVIERYPIIEPFELQPGETRTLPFRLQVPFHTPLTIPRHGIYLQTGLDIANALDPSDSDVVHIQPHPLQQKVFATLQQLGFYPYTSENEARAVYGGGLLPFRQEFEFKPSGGPFGSAIQEVEVSFELHPQGLNLRLEIDKRSRGFAALLDSMDLNERYRHLQFTMNDLHQDWTQHFDHILRTSIRS